MLDSAGGRDVYFWNDDSILDQFRTRPGSQVPRIVNPSNDRFNPWYAVDYHNKRVAFIAGNPAPRYIGITPTLNLKNGVILDAVVGQLVGGYATPMAIAVDWVHRRIYYIVVKQFTPQHIAIRSIDYDGANHVELVELVSSIPNPPFSDKPVTIYPNFLNYEPISDRIFFMRAYTLLVGGPPGTPINHYQVCSFFSDGTGFAVDVELPDLVSYQPGFLAFQLNQVLMRWRVEALELGEAWSISAFDLSTGVETKILTSIDNGVDPYFRPFCPQYCYRDGKIYFCRFMIRTSPPPYYPATYERMNVDGSNQEVIFSFADPVSPFNHNPFNWGNSINSIFRVGRGFETTGPDYVGVG